MTTNRNSTTSRYVNQSSNDFSNDSIFKNMNQEAARQLLAKNGNAGSWLIRESSTPGMLTVDQLKLNTDGNLTMLSSRYAYVHEIGRGWELVTNKNLSNFSTDTYIPCYAKTAQFNLFSSAIYVNAKNDIYINQLVKMLEEKGLNKENLLKATDYEIENSNNNNRVSKHN